MSFFKFATNSKELLGELFDVYDGLVLLVSPLHLSISAYENGITFPTAETLEKILNYFQIDPNTLFKYENSNDDDIEEIRNMLLNHKRLHHELGFFHAIGEDNPLEDLLKKDYPSLDGKYSSENILDFQRYIFLENIKKTVIEMEQESFKQGNPLVPGKK